MTRKRRTKTSKTSTSMTSEPVSYKLLERLAQLSLERSHLRRTQAAAAASQRERVGDWILRLVVLGGMVAVCIGTAYSLILFSLWVVSGP